MISGGPMAETMHSKILGRMAGRVVDDADDQPLTAARAVRLAVTKAANDTVGLVLTVSGMTDDVQPLDGLLAELGEDLMLVGLQRDRRLAGIIALDMQLRAAVLEMQTVGSLISAGAETRPATRTDRTMCDPLLDALVQVLGPAMAGSELEGWINSCQTGQSIGSARAAGLVLLDHDYRILRLTLDLGVADRQGLLVIALPPVKQPDVFTAEQVEDMDWGSRFRLAVSDAPATLQAHLRKFTIPLSQAQSLQVGQILPLPGCDVHSVRLIAPDGKKVAQAKLGQLGGMRAVRVEQAPQVQMGELTPPGAVAPIGVLDTAQDLDDQPDSDDVFATASPLDLQTGPRDSDQATDMDFPSAAMNFETEPLSD